MIQTKDFFLFILVLLFLFLAIAITVTPAGQSGVTKQTEVSFSDDDADYGAVALTDEIDRGSVVERLRNQIADADLILREPEPVETSAENAGAIVGTTTVGTQTCVVDAADLLAVVSWPTDAQVREQAGVIQVFTTETVHSTTTEVVGMTTMEVATTTVVTNVMWSVPRQLGPGEATCDATNYIGVAADGELLRNDEVAAYAATPTDTLVGYARDGVPIYGVYTGELDQCGGYQHPTGYRYSLTPFSTEFINCYSHTPTNF